MCCGALFTLFHRVHVLICKTESSWITKLTRKKSGNRSLMHVVVSTETHAKHFSTFRLRKWHGESARRKTLASWIIEKNNQTTSERRREKEDAGNEAKMVYSAAEWRDRHNADWIHNFRAPCTALCCFYDFTSFSAAFRTKGTTKATSWSQPDGNKFPLNKSRFDPKINFCSQALCECKFMILSFRTPQHNNSIVNVVQQNFMTFHAVSFFCDR